VFADEALFRSGTVGPDVQRDGRAIQELVERLAHRGRRWLGSCRWVLGGRRGDGQQDGKTAPAQSIHGGTRGSIPFQTGHPGSVASPDVNVRELTAAGPP